MTCHGMTHLTRGLAYCPQGEIVGDTRYVLPLNLALKTDSIKIDLKTLESIKLNAVLNTNKLNLVQLPSLKIFNKLGALKINLKKCEG